MTSLCSRRQPGTSQPPRLESAPTDTANPHPAPAARPRKGRSPHTAGTAPGCNGGAGAVIVAADEWAEREGRTPLARGLSYGTVADDFPYLARTPANAAKQALEQSLYLGPAPVVTDCLEFNASLRVVDPAEELAYLAMECEREGAAFVEQWLFAAYVEATDDNPASELITFYKCYCAFLRARIAIRHLDDRDVPAPQKWQDRALSYLHLAQSYIARLP